MFPGEMRRISDRKLYGPRTWAEMQRISYFRQEMYWQMFAMVSLVDP
jgi:hypothetical protein